jgi:hypothetical protein
MKISTDLAYPIVEKLKGDCLEAIEKQLYLNSGKFYEIIVIKGITECEVV